MIPKPVGLRSRYPLSKLRAFYDWSDDQFNALRQAIHSFDKQYFQDDNKASIENLKECEEFKLGVVTKFPELENFEDYWPARVLLVYGRRVATGRARELRKRRKIQTARHNKQSSSGPVFVGNPLPLHMQLQAKKMAVSTASRPKVPTQESVRSSSPTSAQPSLSHRPARLPQLRTAMTTGPSMTRPRPETRVLTGNIAREQQTIEIGCVVCLFCNFTPDVPTSAKSHIQMFSRNQGIISALARLGIVNNKHLYILKLLMTWNAGPKQFLASLGENVLTPLYNLSLLQHFDKYYLLNAPPSSFRSINCRSGCPDHSTGHNDRPPPKLQRLLEALRMEELVPLFIAACVKTDDDFDLLHDLDKSQRLMIFEGDRFKLVRPFQRWMLNFLLAHIDG